MQTLGYHIACLLWWLQDECIASALNIHSPDYVFTVEISMVM